MNAPPTDAARMPTPSQSGQTRGSVPALAPVPEQSGHGASEESLSYDLGRYVLADLPARLRDGTRVTFYWKDS